MTGGVASSGKRLPSVLTRSRTSCVADSRLRSSLKVAITIAVPCPQTDLSSLMPSTVLTTSSIGCAMSDSTSSGAAPGRLTRTETVGRSTEGKRSTPSLKNPAAPITTNERTIMAAKTGRRIQISANFCIKTNRPDRAYTTLLTCLVYDFDSLTRLQVARIDNNLFPNIDSGNDLSKFTGTPASRDRFLQRFSILNGDHFLDTRKSDDGIVRNCHSHLRVVGHDLSVSKRSGPQLSIISYVRFNH